MLVRLIHGCNLEDYHARHLPKLDSQILQVLLDCWQKFRVLGAVQALAHNCLNDPGTCEGKRPPLVVRILDKILYLLNTVTDYEDQSFSRQLPLTASANKQVQTDQYRSQEMSKHTPFAGEVSNRLLNTQVSDNTYI